MFCPLRAIGVCNDDISRCQCCLHVTGSENHAHQDILLAADNFIGTGFHGFKRVEHTLEHLVLHFNRPERRFRRGLINRRDRGNRIPLEAHFIDRQNGLVG